MLETEQIMRTKVFYDVKDSDPVVIRLNKIDGTYRDVPARSVRPEKVVVQGGQINCLVIEVDL